MTLPSSRLLQMHFQEVNEKEEHINSVKDFRFSTNSMKETGKWWRTWCGASFTRQEYRRKLLGGGVLSHAFWSLLSGHASGLYIPVHEPSTNSQEGMDRG